MQIFLVHVVFYMSVLGIVAEIMEDEKLEKEKPDNEYHWRNEDILTNIDIVDAMNGAGDEDTRPESFYTFHTRVTFPSERFLTKWEISWVVDETEEGKPTTSVERHTNHTKECMWEVSKYCSKQSVIHYGFMILTSLVEINHILDVFCKSEAKRNDGDAIHIVGDTLCFDSTSEEEPKHNQSHKSCSTSCQEYCVGVSCAYHAVNKCSNDKDIDENNRKPQRLPDTENQECQFCELFEKCEEENNSILSVFLGEIESSEIALEIIDKVISFDI